MAAGRWRALVRARVAWQAVYPGPRWWRRHQLAWIEIPHPAGDVDRVVRDLARVRRVMSLDLDLDGGLLAAVAAPDWRLTAGPLLAGVPGTTTTLAVELHASASRWQVGALTPTGRAPGPPLDAPGIGPADARVRALGGALGPDPRRPITDIATRLGVSANTATRWLDSALTGGDLGIRVELPPEAAGHPVALHWWLRVPDTDHPRLVDALLAQPDVRWVAGVLSPTGATVLAAAWCAGLAATRALGDRITSRCPTAVTVRLVVTRRPVKRLGWLLDPNGRRAGYVPLDI